MSHLGMKILYSILNANADIACERVFAPWTDMEARMRERGLPLLSMETQTPVRDFDVLGFSLQYELSYTNILAMLDLAGIAVHSEERGKDDPLVVAGGPCAFNPEPVAPFVDVFLLGDAEDSLLELTMKVREWRAAGLEREEMLREANRFREAYVPQLCRDVHHERTGIRHVPRVWVMKRTLKDIDQAPYPTELVVPFTETVHDRVTFEVSRGCQVGCRFCQAGIIYRPARDREVETIVPIVEKSLRATGYDEVSLMSLNAGGYPHIHEVAKTLVEQYRGENVGVALSSLRAPLLTKPLAEAVGEIRKTGFTIAAECGTERLRRIINKNIRHEDVIQAAHNAYGNGWSLIKLYFMIGLPTETLDDVDAIVELGREVLQIGKHYGGRARVNLGVSSFVPKPHTPFQWLPMDRPEVLHEKQDRLYAATRRGPIRVKGHNVEQSALECVLSRGDRSVARVVEEAYRRGLRFDGWGECFDHRAWQESFAAVDVDPDRFCYETWTYEDPLPWDHIRTGVFKGFLYDELVKATNVEETPECGPDLCFHCGPCSKDFLADLKEKRSRPYPELDEKGIGPRIDASFSFRVKYRKRGMLRFLSHLDVVRSFNRAVHRAQLPMAYSQGFHPMPRISMGPALPVGISGESELCDLELRTWVEPDVVLSRLSASMVDDLKALEVTALPPGSPSLTSLDLLANISADVSCLGLDQSHLEERLAQFLAADEVVVERKKKKKTDKRDVRKFVESARWVGDGRLSLRLHVRPSGSASPHLVLQGILGRADVLDCEVVRTSLESPKLQPETPRVREPITA